MITPVLDLPLVLFASLYRSIHVLQHVDVFLFLFLFLIFFLQYFLLLQVCHKNWLVFNGSWWHGRGKMAASGENMLRLLVCFLVGFQVKYSLIGHCSGRNRNVWFIFRSCNTNSLGCIHKSSLKHIAFPVNEVKVSCQISGYSENLQKIIFLGRRISNWHTFHKIKYDLYTFLPSLQWQGSDCSSHYSN